MFLSVIFLKAIFLDALLDPIFPYPRFLSSFLAPERLRRSFIEDEKFARKPSIAPITKVSNKSKGRAIAPENDI
jgi:hypothetical protein